MGCGCSKGAHTREAVEWSNNAPKQEQKTLPTEQCLACCQKHMDEAWCLFSEYGYSEENRRLVRGNLRAIVLHSSREWREIAELARECALLVQEARDSEAIPKMLDLCHMIDGEYLNANPEVRDRLDAKVVERIPVIIPLGNGSTYHNDELRLLLRSLDTNAVDLGEIYVVSTCAPDWLQNVTVVPLKDIYGDDKDGCLHYKTLETIRRYNIGKFCWASDDNCLMCRMRLADIPVIHNHRPNSRFYEKDQTKWQRRVMATLEWAKARGVELEHNYECHCLQCFDGRKLLEGMEGINYHPDAKTIYTTWRVATDTWKGSTDQREWKETYEMPQDAIFKKPLIGYNDAGFPNIRKALFERFPNKSRFEK